MLGTLLSSDDFALCDIDIKLGETAFDVGEMEGKHTKITAPDFLSGTHFFPVLCTSASYGRETLPASRSLSIIRGRNKGMGKMTTPSSQRKSLIVRALLLCQKEKMVM